MVQAVAFEIVFEKATSDRIPTRLRTNSESEVSVEDIEEKLRKAEERRQAYKAARAEQARRTVDGRARVKAAGPCHTSKKCIKRHTFNQINVAFSNMVMLESHFEKTVIKKANLKKKDLRQKSCAMSYELCFGMKSTDAESPVKGSLPSRLWRSRKQRPASAEQLEERLKKAEERRKALEEARLERSKEKAEAILRLDRKMSALIAQEAKRRGLPGTEHIQKMSKGEVVRTLKEVSEGFEEVSKDLEPKLPPVRHDAE